MNRKILDMISTYDKALPIEVLVKYHGSLDPIKDELGVLAEPLSEDYGIITLYPDQVPFLDNYRQIEYIELPKRASALLDPGLDQSCVPGVWAAPFNLTGAGVLIGIIDTGIDYTHPAFRNADGTTRIRYLMDQNSGREYTKEDINAALASPTPLAVIPQMDTIGHGTAVAGIAASSAEANRGVAFEAELLIVRLGTRGLESFALNTEIMRGVKYIIDKATALEMPVALNISYGTNEGAHDGEGLFESYLSDMAGKWKSVIVVAAGNEGAAGHHYVGALGQEEILTVEFSVAPYLPSLYLSLWKDFADGFSIELLEPGGEGTGPVLPNQMTDVFLGNTQVHIFSAPPTPYQPREETYFRLIGGEGGVQAGIWTLRLSGRNIVNGVFDIWLPTVEEVSTQTAFLLPSPELTMTLPATAHKVLSIGGYNGSLGAIAGFSGRGYVCHHHIKPDVCAPAVNIRTTWPGGGYNTLSGTSMAAPFVAGAAALMMQWGIIEDNDPTLYGQRLKEFLIRGAKRLPHLSYPNTVWGYGSLCLTETMLQIEEMR